MKLLRRKKNYFLLFAELIREAMKTYQKYYIAWREDNFPAMNTITIKINNIIIIIIMLKLIFRFYFFFFQSRILCKIRYLNANRELYAFSLFSFFQEISFTQAKARK